MWRCESSPAHHHHAFFLRALESPRASRRDPGEESTACRAVQGGFDPRRGRHTSPHQGGLTGRARGSEPRNGGSSPSPGAKTTTSTRPGQMGRRRSAEPPRPGSIPGVGSTRWSSSEVERHAETVRVRRLKTVLQRHSRVAQRLEQLPYKQKIAGSSPCLGNHTLVA